MSLCDLSDPAFYYRTLQIPLTATYPQIKQSYKRLAFVLLGLCQIHHPDKNNGEEQSKIKFRQIIQAYNVLSDHERREKYDKYGLAGFEEIQISEWMQQFGTFEQFFSTDLVFDQWKAGNRYGKKSGFKNKRRFKRKEKKVTKKQKCKLGRINNEMWKNNSAQLEMIQKVMQGQVDGQLLQQLEQEIDAMILDSDSQNSKEFSDSVILSLDEEEQRILEFAMQNVQTCPDKSLLCKIDNIQFQEEDILTHFSEFHLGSFRDWQQEQRPSDEIHYYESKEYEDFDY